MPHKILGDNKHRYNRSVRTGSPGAGSTLSAVEAQLMNMFQQDFLSLIGTFQSVDWVIHSHFHTTKIFIEHKYFIGDNGYDCISHERYDSSKEHSSDD